MRVDGAPTLSRDWSAMTSDQDTNPDAELPSGEESLDQPGISLRSSAARPQVNRNFSASAVFPGRKERAPNRAIDPPIKSGDTPSHTMGKPPHTMGKKLQPDGTGGGEQVSAKKIHVLPEKTLPPEVNDLVGDKNPQWAGVTTPRRKTDSSVLVVIGTTALLVTAILFGGHALFRLSGELDAIKEELADIRLSSPAAPAAGYDLQNIRDDETATRIKELEIKMLALATPPESTPPDADSTSIDSAVDALKQRVGNLETLGQPLGQQGIGKAELQKLVKRLSNVEASVAALTANTDVRKRLEKLEQASLIKASKTYLSEPRQNLAAVPVVGAQQHGNWFINVGTFSDRGSAEKLLTKVQDIAERAEIQIVTADNRSLYRIRASGYRSRRAAELQAESLQAATGLSGLWIDEQ